MDPPADHPPTYTHMNRSVQVRACHCHLPDLCFEDLARELDPTPSLIPVSRNWRNLVDRSSKTILFYQLHFNAAVPSISRSLRIIPADIQQELGYETKYQSGFLGVQPPLVPQAFLGEYSLGLPYIHAVIGKNYVATMEDVTKLLEHLGMATAELAENQENSMREYGIPPPVDERPDFSSLFPPSISETEGPFEPPQKKTKLIYPKRKQYERRAAKRARIFQGGKNSSSSFIETIPETHNLPKIIPQNISSQLAEKDTDIVSESDHEDTKSSRLMDKQAHIEKVLEYCNTVQCCKAKCIMSLPTELVAQVRMQITALPKRERHAFLMGKIMDTCSMDHTTGTSDNFQCRKFPFDGVISLCKQAFQFVFLTKTLLCRLRKQLHDKGIELSHLHGISGQRKNMGFVNTMETFITSYADEHGTTDSSTSAEDGDLPVIYLPFSPNRRLIWLEYVKTCNAMKTTYASLTSFIRYWKNNCPHIKFQQNNNSDTNGPVTE